MVTHVHVDIVLLSMVNQQRIYVINHVLVAKERDVEEVWLILYILL